MLLAESIKTIWGGNFYAPNAALCHWHTQKKFLFAMHPAIENFSRVSAWRKSRNGDPPCPQRGGHLIQMWAIRGEMTICRDVIACAGDWPAYSQCIIFVAIAE
ncbi:hypothetical protein PQR37_20930 [Paraburkholderia nemoris]|uniref:hypothetical protein n=1 Tax=Paraburkholderia nemoris TaxID=2793076 RepID=UPI0038B8EF87